MLTMILGGLWHGAAWNYVLWGTYHGGLLSVHRALRERFGTARDDPAKAILKIGGWTLTLYGWLLFQGPLVRADCCVHGGILYGEGRLIVRIATRFSAAFGVVFPGYLGNRSIPSGRGPEILLGVAQPSCWSCRGGDGVSHAHGDKQ